MLVDTFHIVYDMPTSPSIAGCASFLNPPIRIYLSAYVKYALVYWNAMVSVAEHYDMGR